MARVITTAAACPEIELDGVARADGRSCAPRDDPAAPDAQRPGGVEAVRVSGARLREADSGVDAPRRVAGRALPLPKANPRRIVVMGDTGCRIKTADRVFQACNDAAQWPFAAVAGAAADARPDLVIHVGDYHYRENACPAGNAGCAGSPWGYGWDAWEADLFAPAERLLAAAPWIVVRGNHESCSRAGQGWWRFLDPRPLAPRQDCNAAADDASGDYSEPYAVPLGSARRCRHPVHRVRFVAGRRRAAAAERSDARQVPGAARARVRALGATAQHVLHEPPSDSRVRAEPGASPTRRSRATARCNRCWDRCSRRCCSRPSVQALLAGHVHLFEVVSFSTPQPAQFVSGNGGDWIDTPLPSPLPAGTTPMPGRGRSRAWWRRTASAS